MKKRMYLICIVIVLTLVTGCIRQDNGLATTQNGDTIQPDKPVDKPTDARNKQQSTDTSDWELAQNDTVNNLKGVSMTVKEGSVSSTKVTVVFNNTADKRYMYGSEYRLEGKIDGSWCVVPVLLENYGWNAIGFILGPGDQRELVIDWAWLYGMLNPGEYRMLKGITYSRAPGDYDIYVLAAEFSIAPTTIIGNGL